MKSNTNGKQSLGRQRKTWKHWISRDFLVLEIEIRKAVIKEWLKNCLDGRPDPQWSAERPKKKNRRKVYALETPQGSPVQIHPAKKV